MRGQLTTLKRNKRKDEGMYENLIVVNRRQRYRRSVQRATTVFSQTINSRPQRYINVLFWKCVRSTAAIYAKLTMYT